MKTLNKIFTISVEVLEFSFDLLIQLFADTPQKKKGYNAGFVSAGTLLSSFNYGFNLTGNRQLSVKKSFENSMVVGGSGRGKSSAIILPTLFSTNGSFIINDPSGELFAKSSMHLKNRGYNVRTINFSNHKLSSGYNPLDRAKTSSDIQKIASLLIENSIGGKGKDPFWTLQSISLLTMLISILKTQDKEYQNLYNVRQLLNALGGNPQSVDALFGQYADDVLYNEYKSFLSFDDKITSGVVASCKASLQIFNDLEVAQVTSYDNLDFNMFRESPTALFINNSVSDQKYYSNITSIFFDQFFAYLMSRFPNKNEQNVFLLIDEASSLNLKGLEIAIANCRKMNSGILIMYQSFQQCIHQYGKQTAEAIKSNCFSKLYFAGQDLDTCKELSELLGKYEYEDKEKRMRTREVMTPDEVRTIKDNRALIICGNKPPIMARLVPYYKRIRYKKYGSLPPLELSEQARHKVLAILPLKKIQNDVKAEQ